MNAFEKQRFTLSFYYQLLQEGAEFYLSVVLRVEETEIVGPQEMVVEGGNEYWQVDRANMAF